ncbi:DUF1963 domain-containing protein [Leptolyngbya sp. FACHB-541]|uniref:DUF1963 domain-containing protein n=1 Tax=Leptolyngbya sp. FACHB-541 TaxID=2692810 RepID=UPI0016831EB2|nr:DUF1963 domain-containing protein [Leptolyngbya sp. FACHB-541]MBD1999703.1 DUF1963 domain-containing protein [Leptolyngbya sp. FACHB-541]
MSDPTLNNVEAKLAGLRRLTWKPIVQVGESPVDASKTSGKVWLTPGEIWPTCPNCQNPMRLVLQLNLQALPVSLNQQFGEGLLQLFCCESDFEIHTGEYISVLSSSVRSEFQIVAYTTDMSETVVDTFDLDGSDATETSIPEIRPCRMWACEAFSSSQLIRIVQPQEGSADVPVPAMEENFPAKQIVGWQESQEYPNIEELETFGIALNDQEIELLLQSELHPQAGDKLGGWVGWAQAVDYPSCPICNQAMNQLIFQLEWSHGTNFPYPHDGLGVGYLVQCPGHREQVTFFCQFT